MAKLGEICTFQSGGTPSKTHSEYFGGNIPWVSTTALNGNVIKESDAVAWITPKAIQESAAKIVPANSIMVGTRVGIGKVAVNSVERSTSQDVISLVGIDESKWHKPYLCELLSSKKDYFNSQARGATIKGIKIDIVANVEIPGISYAKQKHIADILYKVKCLISLRKQQLSKLDELVKARFVEMFGDPVYNEMHWETKRLIDICRTIVDCPHSTPHYTTKDTGYKCIRTSAVKKNKILWEKVECISKQEYEERIKRKRPEKGDVIYTREGAILGIAAVIDRDYNVALGQRSMLLSPDIYKYTPCFLSMAMNFDSFLGKALGGVSGSASPHINVGDIKALEIIAPPIEIQNQFSTFVEQVDQQKQTVQQSLEKLELMKKALMQEYFG